MMQFTSQITDEEYWPLLCGREYPNSENQKQFFKDGFGCTDAAYTNLTASAEKYLDNELGQE